MMMMLPQFHFERTRTPFSTPPSLPNLGGTDRRLVEDEVEVVLGAAGPPVYVCGEKGRGVSALGTRRLDRIKGKGRGHASAMARHNQQAPLSVKRRHFLLAVGQGVVLCVPIHRQERLPALSKQGKPDSIEAASSGSPRERFCDAFHFFFCFIFPS